MTEYDILVELLAIRLYELDWEGEPDLAPWTDIEPKRRDIYRNTVRAARGGHPEDLYIPDPDPDNKIVTLPP